MNRASIILPMGFCFLMLIGCCLLAEKEFALPTQAHAQMPAKTPYHRRADWFFINETQTAINLPRVDKVYFGRAKIFLYFSNGTREEIEDDDDRRRFTAVMFADVE